MSLETERRPELDWNNDESVVRAAVPGAELFDGGGGAYYIGTQTDRITTFFASPLRAWATMRDKHPIVQAFEAQHRPETSRPSDFQVEAEGAD